MVQTAIFSPDGRTVASAGRDRTARLWDANTGFQIGPSLLHGQSVASIAFRPGQPVLASAGADRAVRFWRVPQVATGTPLELRQRVQRLTGLELGPDSSLRPLSADAWLRLEPTSAPSP
jgi:WD40 repeat protein